MMGPTMTDTTNAWPVLPELEPARYALGSNWTDQQLRNIEEYGRQCAEHVAGPLRERIAELEQMFDSEQRRPHHGTWAAMLAECQALRSERDRLRAENEALRADAERYRWLEEPGSASIYIHTGPHETTLYACKERMRAAIDAARAAREG